MNSANYRVIIDKILKIFHGFNQGLLYSNLMYFDNYFVAFCVFKFVHTFLQ